MAMAGCASRVAVDDLSAVATQEVIVVGRIELTPPLTDEDQILHGIGTGKFKNKVFVITSEEWYDKQGGIEPGDDAFEATLGEPFYIKGPNKPFYFLTSVIYTEVSSKGAMRNVNLPGGVKIDLRNKDKAVYIGTIRYTRNEYFDITRAEINDDYDRANAAFKKKFGAKYNLRKALAVPMRGKGA
jgi:hypothetical protein